MHSQSIHHNEGIRKAKVVSIKRKNTGGEGENIESGVYLSLHPCLRVSGCGMDWEITSIFGTGNPSDAEQHIMSH